VSALLAEELLEKIMLAKTKHKKLWKFYPNGIVHLLFLFSHFNSSCSNFFTFGLCHLRLCNCHTRLYNRERILLSKEFMILMNLAIWY
jgi:hypothetical protein